MADKKLDTKELKQVSGGISDAELQECYNIIKEMELKNNTSYDTLRTILDISAKQDPYYSKEKFEEYVQKYMKNR